MHGHSCNSLRTTSSFDSSLYSPTMITVNRERIAGDTSNDEPSSVRVWTVAMMLVESRSLISLESDRRFGTVPPCTSAHFENPAALMRPLDVVSRAASDASTLSVEAYTAAVSSATDSHPFPSASIASNAARKYSGSSCCPAEAILAAGGAVVASSLATNVLLMSSSEFSRSTTA